MSKYYAVYNSNEELKCVGTSKEVADYLGYTLSTFYSQYSVFKNGLIKKMKKHEVYEIEEDCFYRKKA